MSAGVRSSRVCGYFEDPTECSGSASYELRFAELLNPRRGYAFPCDAHGLVDIDNLGDLARLRYFYARTVIGREFHAPVICSVVANGTE